MLRLMLPSQNARHNELQVHVCQKQQQHSSSMQQQQRAANLQMETHMGYVLINKKHFFHMGYENSLKT